MKLNIGSGKQNILWLLTLSVVSVTMGCASGTTRTQTQQWKFDEETIQAVKEKCTGVFDKASGGTIDPLWTNKRAILKQARACSISANTLAEQAENRNKVIGN